MQASGFSSVMKRLKASLISLKVIWGLNLHFFQGIIDIKRKKRTRQLQLQHLGTIKYNARKALFKIRTTKL
jgi:hypothetical protein